MSPGAIWWGQIGNSLRLLTKVTNDLRDCQSAVLQVPQNFPWRQDFYEAIDIRRSSFGGERRMVRLSWQEGMDPGEFVLDELCSSRVRADYWPGQTYAEYLGSKCELMMNDYYVWVTDIHSKADLSKWIQFVSQYHDVAKQRDYSAVFILEYDGASADIPCLDKIVYTVEKYDCRVFSLEAAAALGNTELRDYQAELALSICDNNPELCFALLMTGIKLLQNPVQATLEVTSRAYSSDGLPFAVLGDQQIQSSAWEASIVLLFPVLERYRMSFIGKNESELKRHLPISNSNGDRVTEPCDLEIGALYYIVSSANKVFSVSDVDAIRLCRKVRNLLAHNKIVPINDVQKVFDLK